jgi:hypothetical protein
MATCKAQLAAIAVSNINYRRPRDWDACDWDAKPELRGITSAREAPVGREGFDRRNPVPRPTRSWSLHSRWARRSKIDLTEFLGASWILTAPESWVYLSVAEASQMRGFAMPKIGLVASSALLTRYPNPRVGQGEWRVSQLLARMRPGWNLRFALQQKGPCTAPIKP